MKSFFLLLALLFLTGLSISAQTTTVSTEQQRLNNYFKAFNSGDEKVMRDFFNENLSAGSLKQRPMEQRLEVYGKMHGDMESVEVKQVIAKSTTEITAIAQTKRGEWFSFTFGFESQPPQKIVGIQVENTDAPNESAANQSPPLTMSEFLTSVENYLAKTQKADEFSGVVLIAKNDKPVYEKAFGLANKDTDVPNRVDTKFNLGSINKIFTQIAIGQLAEQGKLSFDDKLGKYLPDYPNKEAAQKVTVRHLLSMTSGIGDIFGENYMATPKTKLRNISDYIPLFSDKPLVFEPGTQNQYSNGGYILLGAIIEKVSGKNYYDYMRENIFKPLGMINTDFYESDKLTPNMAEGYTKNGVKQDDKAKWQNNFSTRPARGSSAGGGYSTVEDMLKFSLALQTGKIKKPNLENQPGFMGLGIAGGAPGINAAFEVKPQTGYTIVVMSNYDPPSAEKVSKQLRNLLAQLKN